MTREQMLEKITQAKLLVEEVQTECGEVAGALSEEAGSGQWSWTFLHGYLAAAWDLIRHAEAELSENEAAENYPNA